MDFATLYAVCYPAVQNEMLMREGGGQMTGGFVRDDFPVDGKLYAIAWALMAKEHTVLHFPETYGRRAIAEMRDTWGNLLTRWTKPGYYYINRPGVAIARIEVAIDVDARSERDHMMALDVQNDFFISDLAVGGNEYEDKLALIKIPDTITMENVDELPAKQFFAIASVIVHYNPPKDKRIAQALRNTETAQPQVLEAAKQKALLKYTK